MPKWFYLTIAALVSAVVLWPSRSEASNCGTVRRITYAQPSYHHQNFQVVKEVIAVPTIFFQFIAPAQAVVAPAGITTAPIGQAAQPAAQAPQESDSARIDRLIRQRLEAIIKEYTSQPDDLPMVGDGGSNDAGADLGVRVATALHQRCASCHTGANSKGKVILFPNEGLFQPNVPLTKIIDAVAAARMPPAAKGDPNHPSALPAADIALLRQLAAQR